MKNYDTVIIGSGISGMTCAIYLKRANQKVLIIEKEAPGGELNKASTIENYPGYEKISGPDLAYNIYNQLQFYQPDFLFEEVMKIIPETNTIKTSTKEINYKNLVIATGRRNRTLNLENEDKYIGKGISFCATCDGALYKNEDVIVIGGANSAISEALYLSEICNKVYLIYRKEQLRGEEILKERLNAKKNIEIIYNTEITNYVTENDHIAGIKLKNQTEIKASCIFLAIGYLPNSELIDVKKENNYIIVDQNGKTSLDHVYACGDVIKKELYQLVTSSSEGAIVANNIIKNK